MELQRSTVVLNSILAVLAFGRGVLILAMVTISLTRKQKMVWVEHQFLIIVTLPPKQASKNDPENRAWARLEPWEAQNRFVMYSMGQPTSTVPQRGECQNMTWVELQSQTPSLSYLIKHPKTILRFDFQQYWRPRSDSEPNWSKWAQKVSKSSSFENSFLRIRARQTWVPPTIFPTGVLLRTTELKLSNKTRNSKIGVQEVCQKGGIPIMLTISAKSPLI